MFTLREYVKAASLEEAWQLNQKKSSVILGGMMWLKMSSLAKGTAIDLSDLNLDKIEETEEEFIIGCMCTLRQLELSESLNRYFNDIFRECTRHIVGVQFRNGATVGGSLFGRYGFSDILTCLMALDTTVELYKGGLVPIRAFSKMPYDRDILVRVRIKKDGRKAAYVTQRRTKTDFPLIACSAARLKNTWYFCVGARPARADVIEVNSDQPDGAAAANQFRYGDNVRGSGKYRKALAEIYLSRLIKKLEEE